MQSPFAKPLDRSFVDFFAKTGMQSPFAKLLELLDLWGSRVSASVTRVCFSLTIQNIHHM
jgi:hypothetical protein